jgi:Tfp pilus assembly protein FimT
LAVAFFGAFLSALDLVVVLALLGAAALSGWIAARRWQAMTQRLSEEP